MSIVCKNTPRLELTWLSSFWGTGTGTELQLECGAYNIQTLLLCCCSRSTRVYLHTAASIWGAFSAWDLWMESHLAAGRGSKPFWQQPNRIWLSISAHSVCHLRTSRAHFVNVLRSCHQQVAVFLWPATALWSASIWKPLRCILHSDCHSSLAASKGALNKDAAVYLSPPRGPGAVHQLQAVLNPGLDE